MATDAEIIQEFYVADQELRTKLAEALSRDEFVALPADVRQARAGLECKEENSRRTRALIAYEQMKSDREDRWITAHEYSTAWRREGAKT